MKISAVEFLRTHEDSWTAKRAQEFSMVNIHVAEIAAPRERIFPELGARDLMLPSRGWRLLFGFRLWLGKIFGWDRGLEAHRPEPFEVGRHYGFFRIEHMDRPREVGISVKNELTSALMGWVLDGDEIALTLGPKWMAKRIPQRGAANEANRITGECYNWELRIQRYGTHRTEATSFAGNDGSIRSGDRA